MKKHQNHGGVSRGGAKLHRRTLAVGLLVAFGASSCASETKPATTESSSSAGVSGTTSKRPTSPFYLKQRIGLGKAQLEVVEATTSDSITTVVVDLFNRDSAPMDLANISALFRARATLFGADIEPTKVVADDKPIDVDGSIRIKLSYVIPKIDNEFPVVMFNGDSVSLSDATIWLTTYDSKADNGS